MFTPHNIHRLSPLAKGNHNKETTQQTQAFNHFHPDNDRKFVVFTCSSPTPQNGVSCGVNGPDQSRHKSNRHLAPRRPHRHRETNNPTRVRGNDWGYHMHPPRRQSQFAKDYFHRRHWIYGIHNQINTRQHRLRHADCNESQNSKRKTRQSSLKNDAHSHL